MTMTSTRNNSFTIQGTHIDPHTRTAQTSVAQKATAPSRRALSTLFRSQSSATAPVMQSIASSSSSIRRSSSSAAGTHRDKIYSSNTENRHIFTTTDRALATKMIGKGATIVRTGDRAHDNSLHYNNDPGPNHYHLKFSNAKEMLSAVKSVPGFPRTEEMTSAKAKAAAQQRR